MHVPCVGDKMEFLWTGHHISLAVIGLAGGCILLVQTIEYMRGISSANSKDDHQHIVLPAIKNAVHPH